jgi:serine/threonine protein kinase
VIEYERCEKCDEKYSTDDKHILYKWCKPCQISNFNKNWTSGNERIDKFIQEVQLNICGYSSIVFEWIPYDQFSDIKKIGEGGFATVYLAKWKDGPLIYKEKDYEYERNTNQEVALKCLSNSQNIPDEFLNEVWNFFINQFKSFLL